MLKYLISGVLLVAATPAMAQLTATEFAEKLKPAVGNPLGETNITVASVKAQGTLGILVLDSPDWGDDRASVSTVFVATFCQSPNFLDKMQIRIDTLEKGGSLVTGPVVTKCPPASE